jgi:RING-H2 zinc finger protein RHA1/RING/U-box domain-containing protein
MSDEGKENTPNEYDNEMKNNDENEEENELYNDEEEETDFENNFYEDNENMRRRLSISNSSNDNIDSYRTLERMLEYFFENEIDDDIENNETERLLTDDFSIIYNSSISRRNNSLPFRSTITGRYTNNIFNTNIFNLNNRSRINPVEILFSSNDLFVDSLYDSVIDSVINESFETQPIPERTNEALDLKVLVYDEICNEEKEKECSICLSEFEKESKVSLISCNHLFHNECIKEWSMYKQNCPICRKKIE